VKKLHEPDCNAITSTGTNRACSCGVGPSVRHPADLSGTAAAGPRGGFFSPLLRAGGFLLKTAAVVVLVGLLMPVAIHAGQGLFYGACTSFLRIGVFSDGR
jgi:hypothetical protein